jgi:hypothetical protein
MVYPILGEFFKVKTEIYIRPDFLQIRPDAGKFVKSGRI